ncbi:MAG: type II secretion system F family protein [Candidatus Marinimicrobia bacterium]|jgi:type IV pilus assembly protein PilC|nr:type II secretion system F family protein [Candidatus Neomarinimicrobiota bacterium]MBT3496629.1 type II secretion system F family protein [Candidatus Neomarinimicrobiota bacterium]MBT3692873.1 type II secretion system F family protein [Candidatus Neomarinimicrobiota bacterium]MBT3732800.1 type II secretion system F family protein [Candidatus Neomarinimicrobiota bacterium]MBT4143730.1 type II secretion system F family protein [Candidatus Neomarinimicrobiota bacterium]
MALFQYLTKDPDGNRKEGEIRADSLDLAAQKLSGGGMLVVKLTEVDTTWDFLGPFLDEVTLSIERFKNRIPLSNIVFFTRQLSTMFSAGLTLERAVQGLALEEKHKKFKKILIDVGENIRKGLNLSESLQRHPGVFSNLFVALTKAGEVSGNLNDILDQLATYLENLDDTRRKVRSAMNYPIFMVIFLSGMIGAMFIFIIPKFSEVYAQLGANLPGATRALVNLSEWMSIHFYTIFFTSIVMMILIWLITKTQRGGFIFDSVLLKLPVFGPLIDQSILNKFCKTFGILLGAGVPVLDSMALLKKVVDNRVYEKAIGDASNYIRDGYNISTALRRTEVFPSILLQLASTGEETGELDSLLDRAADYYFKQVNALVDRMTTLIEPILILAVGAVIALMVVITYLPVFYLGSALQQGL